MKSLFELRRHLSEEQEREVTCSFADFQERVSPYNLDENAPPVPSDELAYGRAGAPSWVWQYFQKQWRRERLFSALLSTHDDLPDAPESEDDPFLPGDERWGDLGAPEWVYDYYNEKWQGWHEEMLQLMSE